MRGQALIEFALVAPLLLFLILGGLQLGFLFIGRMQLEHAATEAAIAGASEPSQRHRCDVAKATVPLVLGHKPDSVTCKATGKLVTVGASEHVALVSPLGIGNGIDVTARAVVRR